MNFKTMTSWFTQKSTKLTKLENYQNLKFRSKIIEEGMDYAQQELK